MDRDNDSSASFTGGGDSPDNGGYQSSAAGGPLLRLAQEALLDPDFYTRLREDPQAAADSLGVTLSDSDAAYLSDVHWAAIDAHIQEMRDALHLGVMRAGPLW